MKNILLFILLLSSIKVVGQENNPTESTDSINMGHSYSITAMTSEKERLEDAIYMATTAAIDANESKMAERYKLYPTENMWTFLKLDTKTGRVWQVQYAINSNSRIQSQFVPFDYHGTKIGVHCQTSDDLNCIQHKICILFY